MEEFVRRYKLECRNVKGAPECMKISVFMYEITNPELIKRLHDKIPKSMDEMMSVTATFLRGEMAASNRERKKSFTLLTKTPREILALDKGKFKPPSPMTTPVEKRNASKFCEFHGEVGHTTDECMHLKRQIEEMLKDGKLSHLIKELKQNHRKDQAKITKKGERQTPGNINDATIEKIARQKITQTFSSELVIYFPTLGEEDGTEGPMIIEAEMGGHCVHRMYVDGGSSLEILEIIWHSRQISLLVRVGDEEHSTSAWMNFMVVRSLSLYNGIIGRPGVRKIRAIPSTAHGMIKFPVAGGIVTLQSSRIIPLECLMVSEPGVPRSAINQLRRHLYVFAWKPTDMTGVPRHIVEHSLNVRGGCLPVRQKKRGQAPERNKAISEEVKKLVKADIMKEVHYHSWLSNHVRVKKHDDSWRMHVDFKDLNKACLKDGYLLPEIDWKVDSLCGYPYKCFLDAYKGYHQIKMAEEDEESVHHKPRNILDTKETFKTLRKINMKLNPKKCAFGKREGTFLGYKVDADGLRVSPNKVKAVLDLPSPKCLKDAQKQNKKLASLNRFLSKSAEKSLLFFKTLKKCTKKSDFQWTLKAEGAFKEMKQSIAELLMLMAPKEKGGVDYVSGSYKRGHQRSINDKEGWEASARLLREHDIQYRPRTSVKGQILADFIVKRPEDDAPDTPMEDMEELSDPWILFTDGSSCVDGSRAGILPWERKKARIVRRKAGRYAVINKVLYKKSFLGPWLRCVGPLQANYVLREIYEGSSSMHAGPRSVVEKASRSGYFLPTMHTDARNLIRECKDCQVHRPVPRNPQEKLTPITSSWPFYKWGIDIARPFSEGPGKEPRRRNQGTVEGKNKNWVEELSHVIWAYRTMIKSSNGETPFSLTYGAEAVIPAEIGMPTLRTAEVDMVKNNEDLGTSLDLLEEKREQAVYQEARNKAKMKGYYNAGVRSTSFRPGDFVYRNNEASHAEDGGKLRPKWEGPYEVTEALEKGAYMLRDHNGHTLP
nr:hypothetical protein [Tanacetum cinerariifolium]